MLEVVGIVRFAIVIQGNLVKQGLFQEKMLNVCTAGQLRDTDWFGFISKEKPIFSKGSL
jgi:hypothetical protein